MFPIILDFQTLSFVLVLVTAFLTFVMIFVWLTQKTYTGFGLWVISNMAVAAGILLLGFEGVWGDVLGTSLTFSAVIIGYEGIRQFLKLKHTLFFSLSIFAFQFLALLGFNFFESNVLWQVSFSSLLVGIISGICGLLFTQNSSEKTNFSYRFTAVTYFVFAVLMIFRSLITVYTADNIEFYKADSIQPLFFLLYILFEIIWTFNYINLNTNRLHNELKQMQTELEKLATTDFLTGINNRRKFLEVGENEIKRAKRFRYPFSVVMFDIDHFKKVNDECGHAAGDKVLVEVAAILQKILRVTDTFGRLGGEEFGVLLPYTNANDARIVSEYLRAAIEETEIKCTYKTIKITASFGVTELDGMDDQIKTILNRADKLLYKAKNNGRNRIVSDAEESEISRELVTA